MPLLNTSGNVTADAYGGGVAAVPNYIEDVFSTWLYSGLSASQTITNGIDLAGKGGLTWIKGRSGTYGAGNHWLFDTTRGATNALFSNATNAQTTNAATLTSFGSTGFSLGSSSETNDSASTYASWTFRKQPKFFDVVTYTGNGGTQLVNHSLGSTPGCIIAKRTDSTGNWEVWHRDLNFGTDGLLLNSTAAATSGNSDISSVNSTRFGVLQTTAFNINVSGATYVAYLFAHNAGGFGLTGTDNVISCGSFTTDGSGNATVNLGYEPQFAILKRTSGVSDWEMLDNMRGWSQTGFKDLYANSSSAEGNTSGSYCTITSTGFTTPTAGFFYPSSTYIYIAIRRGPMKVPTDPYQVFSPLTRTGTGSTTSTSGVGFPTDIFYTLNRPGSLNAWYMQDRLRGNYKFLQTTGTGAEASLSNTAAFDNMDGVNLGANGAINGISTYIDYYFRRAPSFFDEVCYTGTGANTTFSHNLGVAPEMMIVRCRSVENNWAIYSAANGPTYTMPFTTQAAAVNTSMWNSTAPTSSVFSVGTAGGSNSSGATYVAYLFATCAGVSKVGSYTGTGATQTINCGFTGGARFVLIKRTDSTGDWYVYDTARGMTTLTDPYLLLNSTAAESATLGSVTTVSTGFAVNASILAAINTNAASYIFLAIA